MLWNDGCALSESEIRSSVSVGTEMKDTSEN